MKITFISLVVVLTAVSILLMYSLSKTASIMDESMEKYFKEKSDENSNT